MNRLKKLLAKPSGETSELRVALVSQYAQERKDAIRQVIALMTTGKDVSSLFPDVLKNVATHDLAQKKLVYLYLVNHAATHPELCILAVNTFVRDAEDPNPLVRALAIRTMGCVRVDKIVDYIDVPLNRTLADENPYVRKTAAVCVAKLFDLDKEVCVEGGFVEKLQQLVEDANPMVVANAIAALAEIHESDPSLDVLTVDASLLKKLLAALNECTEWGRITILTAIADYASDKSEASHIIERVIPQLQHSNPSVVLSSIKVILQNVHKVDDSESVLKKLSAPLVSLLSTPPEVQFVALRNIRIIVEKYPDLITHFKVFFTRYSDPLYLKLEKLEIIVRLASPTSAVAILNELKEYGHEFDVEFVKRSVKAIAQVGIKVSKHHSKAVDILIELINERELYNEVVIALRDILRAHPEHSSMVVPTIVQAQDKLVDSEAIASYMWVVSEFGADSSRLSDYVDSFTELDVPVQQALVHALVTINVKTGEHRDSLAKVFHNADQVENVEVRDQIYISWRIISLEDSKQLQKLILAKLARIETTIPQFQPELLESLIGELSTLNSVLFTTGVGKQAKTTAITKLRDTSVKLAVEENLLDFGDESVEINELFTSNQQDLLDLF